MEYSCMEAYLSSQLKTFVAIVIPVIHFVVPLSQDHPPHHHRQVNTLSSKVKLLDLQTTLITLCGIYRIQSLILIHLLTYRNMGEDKRRQELPGLLHLGLLGAPPHALSPHFIPEVSQSLKHGYRRSRGQKAQSTGDCQQFQNLQQIRLSYQNFKLINLIQYQYIPQHNGKKSKVLATKKKK